MLDPNRHPPPDLAPLQTRLPLKRAPNLNRAMALLTAFGVHTAALAGLTAFGVMGVARLHGVPMFAS